MMTEKMARSKTTHSMLKTVPGTLAWPTPIRTMPMATASTRTVIATSCGRTRCHAGPVGSCLVFGVTAKSSDRPRNTLPKAEVKDLIQVGNSASEYCWPRQVGRPSATTANSSWLTARNGTSRTKNWVLSACTGSTPTTR